jgi:hypothetical protein
MARERVTRCRQTTVKSEVPVRPQHMRMSPTGNTHMAPRPFRGLRPDFPCQTERYPDKDPGGRPVVDQAAHQVGKELGNW